MTRILAATIAVFVSSSVQGDRDVRVLVAGQTVERSLDTGERHTYQVALRAGEFASVTVEQRGIDVFVRTLDPDGATIATFQDEYLKSGEERPTIVAATTGTYSLVVTPAYSGQGAGEYTIRIAEVRQATAEDRSLQEVAALRTEAVSLYDAGRFEDATARLRRALEIVEGVKGPQDFVAARIVWALATCVLDQRNFAMAEPLFQRALTTLERERGKDDPVTVFAVKGLGTLYEETGQRVKAERALQPSLDSLEKTLGPNHPSVAGTLMVLGLVRHAAADIQQAEAYDRRALTILEASSSTDTLIYANLVNNLGILNLDKGDYAKADDLLRRALVLGERLHGVDSKWAATTFNNLGIIARQRKEYDKAEAYYLRALAIQETAVGPDHPDVAMQLNNLAIVYNNKGDSARALETHFRALKIWEQSAGPYAAPTLVSLGNIARTYARISDIPNAIAFQQRTDAVLEKALVLNIAVGSERQKLAFSVAMSDRTDRTISLNLDLAPQSTDATRLAALVILQRKGRVLDAMTDTLAAVRQRVTAPADRQLLDELKATTAKIAELALNGNPRVIPADRESALRDLEARKERLEAAISDHNLEFRAVSREVTLEAVQSAIPAGSVLLEFAVYRPFDPKAETNSEAYGPPHYAAYVLGSTGEPRGVGLGPTAALDAAIDSLRQALRDPRRADVSKLSRAVDARLLEPLRALIGNATRLLVSPDGALNLIPFEALVDGRGKFAVERYAISYLTSGRDLLRMQVRGADGGGPIVFANPAFGFPSSPTGPEASRSGPASAQRRSVTTGPELSGLYFAPIAGTGEEARAIRALFPDATLFTRGEASKAALAHVAAPRLLHIATHGFFLQPSGTAASNPLLRSGLALAGANMDKGSSVLTALEAANLNLWGTELVTLSACDTGVGEVRNGEGVYGLRRSFFLAGAETLVMSLWPVSDYVTRQVMTAYYTGLKAGQGRGDALRRAQLAMLARPDRRHPFYWASFIQAGDWRPLGAATSTR